jgi:pimeloyl-ACP methyl ester carboxylesterase
MIVEAPMQQDPPSTWPAQRVHTNGIMLHVVRTGSGAPLLLLHGWPEFWLSWRHCIARLSDRFDLIAPDLRGFGDSDKPSLEPSVEATADIMADDLKGLIDALGIARVGLVGHDVGAYVGQAFARRYPAHTLGLFFFNCPYPGIGPRWGAPDHLIEIWYLYFHQPKFAAARVGSSREACRLYCQHFLSHWAHDPHAFDADLEAWVDNFMKPGNLQGGFNWYLSSNASRLAVIKGTEPKPPPIDVPTRVLWGRHDPILKVDWIDRLPEFFSRLELDIAEDAGHFVHYEQPDLAAREIAAFFGKLA